MKLSTILPLATGLGVGYVLGAAAGRSRYDEITQRANDLVHHPKVQQTVFDLADQATARASRLPGPARDLVSTAAVRVQESLTHPTDETSAPTDL